jgi:preprotein translocase subunit SecG
MANVLLVAYLLIVLALIVVILLQRSEGGALGIGGGGGGGLMTARGSANLLTRTTAILATLFFALAIGLTILNEFDRGTTSILDNATSVEDGAEPTTVLDALNALGGNETSDLPLPVPPANETAPTSTGTELPVPEAPAAEAPAAEAPATTSTDAGATPAETPEQTPATQPGS